jgi:hypothetical protein
MSYVAHTFSRGMWNLKRLMLTRVCIKCMHAKVKTFSCRHGSILIEQLRDMWKFPTCVACC